MIDSLDEINEKTAPAVFPISSPSVHIDEIDPVEKELIKKTVAQTGHIPVSHQSETGSLSNRVAPISSLDTKTLQTELGKFSKKLQAIEDNPNSVDHFPNLAWEAIKAGLEKEKITNQKINEHIRDAQKIQKEIDLLLDLSAELTAHKEGAKEPSVKMKALLEELKELGIELWKGEDKGLTPEKISEIKSLSSAQIDKLRSNLQIIFSTKIQVMIQTIGSIMETLKEIIRNNSRLISTANRLPGR